MKVKLTVELTVDVPDDTDVDGLYLNLPLEQVELLSLYDDGVVEGSIDEYETKATETVGADDEE